MNSEINGGGDGNSSNSLPRRHRKKKKKRSKDVGAIISTHNTGVFIVLFTFMMFVFVLILTMQSVPESDVSNPNARVRNFGGEIILSRNGIHPLPNKSNSSESNNNHHDSKKKETWKAAPTSLWPVSIRNEGEDMVEVIEHPGNPKKKMTVPRFWSMPLHDKKFFTREQAMQIGSCLQADANGNNQLGDKCALEDRTIFVAIASYRDYQCRITVESIFQRAKYPARIRVAVVDQISPEEDVKCNEPIQSCHDNPDQALCQYIDQVDVFEMHAQLAVGPVFARHIGHRLYRGEYYAMQSDAHVTFTQDWDVDIIKQQEATGDEMAVQSTYLTDINGSIDPVTGKSLRHTRPIMCNTDYEGGIQGKHLRHLSQPEGIPRIQNSPQLEPYWAAGFSFGRGHFVVNVPYDLYQPMIFQGEEMSIGIRGFTVGYDYFATQRSVCFHHYAIGANEAKRKKVKHFWDNSSLYAGTGIKAMKRLLGIVNMNPEIPRNAWNHKEEDRYGLGGVRTTQKFYDTFGIDVVNKKTEHNLCQFVNGRMHHMFMKHLRPDGMGIDYDKIDYQFKDPAK